MNPRTDFDHSSSPKYMLAPTRCVSYPIGETRGPRAGETSL
jgi:hypothetical protein